MGWVPDEVGGFWWILVGKLVVKMLDRCTTFCYTVSTLTERATALTGEMKMSKWFTDEEQQNYTDQLSAGKAAAGSSTEEPEYALDVLCGKGTPFQKGYLSQVRKNQQQEQREKNMWFLNHPSA